MHLEASWTGISATRLQILWMIYLNGESWITVNVMLIHPALAIFTMSCEIGEIYVVQIPNLS